MVVNDTLTACLLGGILTGVGSGLVLTCGGSGGGLDVIGLCLSKKGSRFTVGRFSMTFNAFLYALCLILFTRRRQFIRDLQFRLRYGGG